MVVLPFHNPVQIAEQVAMVDVMSDGRFDLGIGRGYQRKEFEAMNIDQNEATPRFREGAAIVEGLLHNKHFTYEGDFWTLNDVTVYPRPVQERIRIGVAVIKTPESFDWVLNRGYFALCGNPYALDPELKEGFEEYVRAMERAGGGPGMGNIYSNVFAYAHEDGRKARELAKYSSELYFQRLTAHGTVTGHDGKLPQGYESYTNWDSKVVTGGIPYEEMGRATVLVDRRPAGNRGQAARDVRGVRLPEPDPLAQPRRRHPAGRAAEIDGAVREQGDPRSRTPRRAFARRRRLVRLMATRSVAGGPE